VIRRGFWLTTGAVLGVTGYRRATRLARMLTMPTATSPAGARRSTTRRAVAAAGFARDVRDGMAEYWDLRRGAPHATRRGLTREGRTLEGRTLEGQRDRTWSGERQQGRREP
jgi:hypothetical protein